MRLLLIISLCLVAGCKQRTQSSVKFTTDKNGKFTHADVAGRSWCYNWIGGPGLGTLQFSDNSAVQTRFSSVSEASTSRLDWEPSGDSKILRLKYGQNSAASQNKVVELQFQRKDAATAFTMTDKSRKYKFIEMKNAALNEKNTDTLDVNALGSESLKNRVFCFGVDGTNDYGVLHLANDGLANGYRAPTGEYAFRYLVAGQSTVVGGWKFENGRLILKGGNNFERGLANAVKSSEGTMVNMSSGNNRGDVDAFLFYAGTPNQSTREQDQM